VLLLPLRVEEAEVNRLPWASISIAILCAAMFFVTWVAPRNPTGLSVESMEKVLGYWVEHPYLRLPDRLTKMFPPHLLEGYLVVRAKATGAAASLPEPEQIASEQAELDGLTAEVFRRMDASLLRRLAFVPERGLGQKGLLTHMFLHGGWEHFLGNMLFFYVAALLLEDRWGRGFFVGFYLLGGLVAVLAQYLMETGSQAMVIGASGAVAACMGAFSARFPDRHIRMVWWLLWILHGSFLVRVWVWGLIWFALEVLALAFLGNNSGVAFAAHVGGFAFGAVVALGLKWSGVEGRFLVPAVEKKSVAYARPEGLDRADEAIARGDAAAARKELEAVLAQAPDSAEAAAMLVKLELEPDPAGAHARAERLFARLLAKSSADTVTVVEELGPMLDLWRLRPATSFRMGQALDGAPDGLRPLAERLFAAAAVEPGPVAAKALMRAAQARLDANGEVRGALEYLERLRALSGVAPEILARAAELEQRAQDVVARERGLQAGLADARAIDLEEPPPAPSVAPEPQRSGARVTECQLGGMTAEMLSLVLEGGRQTKLSLASLLAVGVGVAAEPAPPPAPPRNILYTDLVTSWGGPAQPAQVLRLKSSTLRLHNLYPGMKPHEAFGLFLAHLLDRSGAVGLPDAAALRRGEYPRYPDVESFTRALYG